MARGGTAVQSVLPADAHPDGRGGICPPSILAELDPEPCAWLVLSIRRCLLPSPGLPLAGRTRRQDCPEMATASSGPKPNRNPRHRARPVARAKSIPLARDPQSLADGADVVPARWTDIILG